MKIVCVCVCVSVCVWRGAMQVAEMNTYDTSYYFLQSVVLTLTINSPPCETVDGHIF